MDTIISAPGLYFSAKPRPDGVEPVRTDIAAFAGNSRRGPIGQLMRMDDWKACIAMFGNLDERFEMPYALRGYFENGGDVAWVLRLPSDVPGVEKPARIDSWKIAPLAGFVHADFRIEASSPGTWAEGTQIRMHYERITNGRGRVDLIVEVPGEEVEYMPALNAATLDADVNRKSLFLRFTALDDEFPPVPMGPRFQDWTLPLTGGIDPSPGWSAYMNAVTVMEEAVEPSMLAFPDLYVDIRDEDSRREILAKALVEAEAAHDRLVLLDAPNSTQPKPGVDDLARFAASLREAVGTASRSGALYFPYLRVTDPMGGVQQSLRTIAPCGHVAGVISRMDRLRGAHHTPANAGLFEVVDLTQSFDLEQRGVLNQQGVNLLRCLPGQGQMVYGGRTLETTDYKFLAHRRLVHRLVRAIRRVAEPLVFDVNGPELWLALMRAITTVLLEAYRSGALQGARPEEAFRVTCDATTNPPQSVDKGFVLCEIEFAPAVPMEFIHLRVALGSEGNLEVFES